MKTNSEVGAELSAAISRPSVVLKAGALIGPGRYVDDEFHQPLGPYVALARSAEHRDQVALGESQLQTRTQLVLRQYALVEIELHQRLVVLGGRLGQDAVQLGGPFHFRLGDFELLAYAGIALETIHFHQQHVDEGVEAGPGLTGYCTTTGVTCEAAFNESSVPSHDAFSWSSWLMTAMIGFSCRRA